MLYFVHFSGNCYMTCSLKNFPHYHVLLLNVDASNHAYVAKISQVSGLPIYSKTKKELTKEMHDHHIGHC